MCHWRPPKVLLEDRMIGSAAWPVRNYASFCTGQAANPNLAVIRRLASRPPVAHEKKPPF